VVPVSLLMKSSVIMEMGPQEIRPGQPGFMIRQGFGC
jgi:hypothetical protein